MTSPDTDTRHDTDSIIEAARLGVEPTELDLGRIYTRTNADGSVHVLDLTTDAHLRQLDAIAKQKGEPPVRQTGHVRFTEHESLSAYVDNHAVANQTTLWANREQGTIVAVLNGHKQGPGETLAGHGDHKATLTLTKTPAWKAWTEKDGMQQRQDDFADFLEDHLPDIVEPDGAHLLEVATSIQATTGAAMKSAIRLESGEVKIRYEESIEATAGKAGDLTIPMRIKLGLTPFEGGELYGVEARLRYRLGNGSLTLAYILDRPEDVLRKAFNDITEKVSQATSIEVLHGTPAA